MGSGTKVCSPHLGHMAKMAATPIYGLRNQLTDFHEIGDSCPLQFVQMMTLGCP